MSFYFELHTAVAGIEAHSNNFVEMTCHSISYREHTFHLCNSNGILFMYK